MKYVSVTVVCTIEHPGDYEPRTSVFSNRISAERFKNSPEELFASKGVSDCFYVSIDSGTIDSDSYLEIFGLGLDDESDEDEMN